MDTKQERAAFEAWYQQHHGRRDMYERDASGEYADKQVQGAFNVWQARATLQSQDAEDAARLRFCLKYGFPQKWEEGNRGVIRTYWTSRPGSQEEFSSAIEAIDTARRIERDS